MNLVLNLDSRQSEINEAGVLFTVKISTFINSLYNDV